MRTWPRRALLLVVALVAAGPLAPPAYAGGIDVFIGSSTIPALVTCDQTVSTRAALITALTSTSSSGKTTCITANITGKTIGLPLTDDPSSDLPGGIATSMTSEATFVGMPTNRSITVPGFQFAPPAKNMTFKYLDFTGANEQGVYGRNSGTMTALKFIDNRFENYTGDGIHFSGGSVTNNNFVITGNDFECITYGGNLDGGYGIYNDSTANGWTISYNTVHGCGNSADGMQISDMHTTTVEANEIDNLHWNGVGTDPHADCIMLWGTSSNDTVQDNRMINCPDMIDSPDGNSITVHNNLFENMDSGNSCLDVTPNGSSGTTDPLNHTWQQNTIWNCAGSGINLNGGGSSRSGNVLSKNLLFGMACPDSNSIFSSVDHNLFGVVNPCSLTGTNTYSFTPAWANTTDYTSPSFYVPTNLPTGYTDAGYSYVPAGYLAAP